MQTILLLLALGADPSDFVIPTREQLVKDSSAGLDAEVASLERQIKDVKSGKAKVRPVERKAAIAKLQSRITAAKQTPPSFPEISLKLGSYGRFDPFKVDFKVGRILDENSLLLRIEIYRVRYQIVGNQQQYAGRNYASNRLVIYRGVATKNLVDDERMEVADLCAFTGTETVDGSKLLVLEPLK